MQPVARVGEPVTLTMGSGWDEGLEEVSCIDPRDASALLSFTPPESGTYRVTVSTGALGASPVVGTYDCEGAYLGCMTEDVIEFDWSAGQTVLLVIQDFFGDEYDFEVTVDGPT